MNLRLGKSDGRELEERIYKKIDLQRRAGETYMAVRRAVDVFAEWLEEQIAPHVGAVDQLAQDYPNFTRTAETGLSYGFDTTMEEIKQAVDELARLRLMGSRLNQLRKNVTATQSATWSNMMYPLVAILNDAGYEDSPGRIVSEKQREAHMNAYGGAGNFPEAD